jgi:hypothetical protein
MRMTDLATAALLAVSVSPLFAAAPSSAKPAAGTIVIVFKDGHRQTLNQADIERIEFPSADAMTSSGNLPSRNRFIGKWEAGDGNGGHFNITLWDNGDARRSIGNVHGKWTYVDGEAHIVWDDGAQDAIRKTGGRYQKFAYEAGKSFNDKPANVTEAHNLDQKPL